MNEMRILVLGTLFVFLSLGCKSSKKNSGSNELKEGSIEMKKTMCFGRCPVYEIKITTKGYVTYLGKKNVSKVGAYHKTLNEKELNELFGAFNNSGIWNMQNEYDAKVSDVPTTYLNYVYDGKSKNIKDRFNGPEELKQLETLVETIADGAEGWVKDEVQPGEE